MLVSGPHLLVLGKVREEIRGMSDSLPLVSYSVISYGMLSTGENRVLCLYIGVNSGLAVAAYLGCKITFV